MENYQIMSDFEIDLAVTIQVTGLEPIDLKPNEKQRVFVAKDFSNDDFPSEIARQYVDVPDYCNNPANAWPIMVKNKIGGHYGKAVPDLYFATSRDKRYIATHQNPLRAAMIVFLIMQKPYGRL